MEISWLPRSIIRGIIHKHQGLQCKRETENSAGDRKHHLKRNDEKSRLCAETREQFNESTAREEGCPAFVLPGVRNRTSNCGKVASEKSAV